MIKREMTWFFAGLLVIASTSFVQANFMCGEVVTETDVTPAWFEVLLHYVEAPEYAVSCEVSPADNKYCCDPTTIDEVDWGIGKRVSLSIDQDGYAARPVIGVISGEGYDVVEPLLLEKNIMIHSPNTTLYLNQSGMVFNVSTVLPYSTLYYKLYLGDEVLREDTLCTDCDGVYFVEDNLPEGRYTFFIIAIDADGTHLYETYSFTLLDSLIVERSLDCVGCGEGIVPSGREVTITLSAETTQPVVGFVEERIPYEWHYLEGGDFAPHTSTHDAIRFFMNGTKFEATYKLRAPKLFITRSYIFETVFADLSINVENVVVYRWYRFLPWRISASDDVLNPMAHQKYLRVTPTRPAVLELHSGSLGQIAVFPTKPHAFADVSVYELSDKMYQIDTSLAADSVSHISVFYTSTNGLLVESYDSLTDSWVKVPSRIIDKSTNYYEARIGKDTIFRITTKKNDGA